MTTGRSLHGLRPVLFLALLALLFASPSRAGTPPDFAQLIRDSEAARGLRFQRPPTLEVLPEPDAAFTALLASTTPLWKREDLLRLVPVTRAVADVAADRVVALAPPDAQEIALALAALLDARSYPDLALRAPAAEGDPGVALRALLAASAFTTAQGGLGETPVDPPQDPLGGPSFEIAEPVSPEVFLRTPMLAATGFLRSLRDREATFRAPPLSTLLLLRPSLYPGRPPLALEGAALPGPGCLVSKDASVGVFELARSVVAEGGSVPGPALAGWEGDRLVEERCTAARSRWRYAASFVDATAARAFAGAAESLVPAAWPRPFAVARSGERVALAHGMPASEALAWARSLAARPIRSLDEVTQSPATR